MNEYIEKDEFKELGRLLEKWSNSQHCCSYRIYSSCRHPQNNYSDKCALMQCPMPKPDPKITWWKEGRFHYFWMEEKEEEDA